MQILLETDYLYVSIYGGTSPEHEPWVLPILSKWVESLSFANRHFDTGSAKTQLVQYSQKSAVLKLEGLMIGELLSRTWNIYFCMKTAST